MGRIGKHLGRNSHRIGSMKLILWSVLICVPLLVNGRGNCVICMEKEVTHIVLPCAHYCLCDCSDEGQDDISPDMCPMCPMCQGKVDKITRVFNVGEVECVFEKMTDAIDNALGGMKGEVFASGREKMLNL